MKLFKRHDILVHSTYFVLPILFFWRLFLARSSNIKYLGGDFVALYYPHYLYFAERLKNFHLPLWDVSYFLGTPSLASFPKMLYPTTVIIAFFGSLFNKDVFLLLAEYLHGPFHLTLAGIFTYLLCKKGLNLSKFPSFIAGFIFMFSGILMGFITSETSAMIWIPIIFYLFLQASNGAYNDYYKYRWRIKNCCF